MIDIKRDGSTYNISSGGRIIGRVFTSLTGKVLFDKTGNGYIGMDTMGEIFDFMRTFRTIHKMSDGFPLLCDLDEVIERINITDYNLNDYLITDMSDRERYDYWFKHNYEIGMEYNPEMVVDYDNEYYSFTPTKKISYELHLDLGVNNSLEVTFHALLLEILGKVHNMFVDSLIIYGGVTLDPLYKIVHLSPGRFDVGVNDFEFVKIC
jgi:hypothetical protein